MKNKAGRPKTKADSRKVGLLLPVSIIELLDSLVMFSDATKSQVVEDALLYYVNSQKGLDTFVENDYTIEDIENALELKYANINFKFKIKSVLKNTRNFKVLFYVECSESEARYGGIGLLKDDCIKEEDKYYKLNEIDEYYVKKYR